MSRDIEDDRTDSPRRIGRRRLLGGVGTFEGPVLGAALVGTTAAGLPWLVIPVLADPLVFVLALLIVKFRPQGFITQGRL